MALALGSVAPRETLAAWGYGDIDDGKDRGRRDPCQTGSGGMPVWWVSEPYINVWISDVPLWYRTADGEPVTFRLTYKQRDTRPAPENLTNACWMHWTGWNHSWSSFIHVEYGAGCGGFGCLFSTAAVTLFLGEGGEVGFAPSGGVERYDSATGLKLQEVCDGSVGSMLLNQWDDGRNGLRLTHRDGSQDIYGFSPARRAASNGLYYKDYLLTRRIDLHGKTTWFNYELTGGVATGYRVKSVVDPDGRTNRLSYNASGLLTNVTSPYGLSAQFTYDANKNLTGIIDAAGLSTTLTYNGNGYPTALVTPYGTNRFAYSVNATNGGGDSLIDRAVGVTEPAGGTHLYLYRNESPFLPTNYPAWDVPTNTPLGTLDAGAGDTNGLSAISYRNSFYWGPRQYGALSSTNLGSLTATDYGLGRMRHWLQDSNELYISDLLSVERTPSPDGVAEGLKVFYDYEGKTFPWRAGAGVLTAVAAWRLPGGETHYEWRRYDEWGNVTNLVNTYSGPSGVMAARTNEFVWALNTYTNVIGTLEDGSMVDTTNNTFAIPNLLMQVIGPEGVPLWTCAGYEEVTWTNDLVSSGGPVRNLLIASRALPRWITNAANEVTALTFGSFDRITSVRSPSGLTTTNLFDGNGFLRRSIGLEIGRTNSAGYTTNGLVGALTNSLGLALQVTWDGLNRLTEVGFPDTTTISNVYDRLYVGARKDQLGHWTRYGYDGLQNLTTVTDARSNVTTLGWCDCGSLESILDALTNNTGLSYNNQGAMTGIQFADGSSVSYTLDAAGRVTRIADGQGKGLDFGYNNQGLVTVVSNAYGLVRRVVYDVQDHPIQVTDANSVTVTNRFDGLGRLTARYWPDGIGEGFGWSTNGLVAYTNRNGKVTRYGRDEAGRLTAVTNANQEVTRVAYNSLDAVTDLWDGRTNHTVWHYNQYGWLSNKVDALGREVLRYTYYPDGRVASRWTPQKGDTAYTWDAVGNLETISNEVSIVSYFYNERNQMRMMIDPVGTTLFTYAPAGQLKTEDGPWAGDTLAWSYTNGLRTSLSLGSAGFGYEYDSSWRLKTLTSPAGTFGYGYNLAQGTSPAALVRTISLPNSAWITNHYDGLSRLDYTALVNRWGHVLDGYSYNHDALGLRTNIVRDLGLTNSSVTVGYDSTGQLILGRAREGLSGPLRQNEQIQCVFDPAGNLRYRTNGGLVQTFNCDVLNQLTNVSRNNMMTVSGATPAPVASVTVNGQAAERYGDFTFARTNVTLSEGNDTFTIVAQKPGGGSVTNTLTVNLPASVMLLYDSNGNLTNDGTRSFAYSLENQLTNITVAGAWKSDFVYDGLGRRRIERDYGWQSNQWSQTNELRFIYDGWLLVQVRDASNKVLWTVTRGLDLSGSLGGAGGIGGLLARTDTNGSTFYHADGVGNITGLMDGPQNMAARYMYSAFGGLVRKSGPMVDVNEMQFSSMPVHRLSGLVGFSLRPTYDPTLGRFLTPDPIGERGGVNLYGFVGNNPLGYVDPYGLAVEPGAWPLEPLVGPIVQAAKDLWGFLKNPSPPEVPPIFSYQEDGPIGPGWYPRQSVPGDMAEPSTSAILTMGLGVLAPEGLPLLRGKPCPAAAKDASKVFSKEKQALVDMAKADKRMGLSKADMETYKDLNKQLPDPFPANKVRGPEIHPNRGPQAQQPHGHVGPVDYIPITDAN